MEKDYGGWNVKKQDINKRGDAPFYHEREVWWCALGVNVGFEQDGTGANYDRPVLIIRGFNPHVFFGVALTGRKREGKYYVSVGEIEGREASVILSQARLIDSKRLIRKMATMSEEQFEEVCVALQRTLFQGNK
jgi:mRNA interferase MazF